MFLRRINVKKSGKDHFYWALVESYRTEKGPRQRIVGYVGDVKKERARGIANAVERCNSTQQDFLSAEELPEKVEVLPRQTETERHRRFGGVWLGNKLFEMLELDRYFSKGLQEKEESASWLDIIKILSISRFSQPSSELHIAEHLYEHSAMNDFFGIPAEQLYDNRLYRGLDKMLPHKDGLAQHLKERLGSLFKIEYDLFLYDMTSTYVEGAYVNSKLCQRGYSRDSRPDCKQVCIALVVTREGLPLGYEVFAGNTHDSKTVEEIVTTMETTYGAADRIWVMDRGMVSEDNLTMLRQKGRRYIIGAPKATLKQVERQLLDKSDWQIVHTGVEVKLCPSNEGDKEVFILCKSSDRALKEKSMHDRFVQRIEAGIEKLQKTCEKRKGKDITKTIERRLGRLLQQNSRGSAFFDIQTSYDSTREQTIIAVKKTDDASQWSRLTEGHYLLRTNITDWKAPQLWEAYIHLTDAEEAFRIHKSDLHLRPLWHQKDERIKAHIFVCFVAFVLWKTFGLMCKQAGLGDEPRRVFEEIKTIHMVDVVLTTTAGKKLKIRSVARPDKPLQVLLHKLGLQLPKRLSKCNL
jgi:transposase